MRGEIKPSDLLYYYENLQHYIGTPIYKDGDITPEGVTMRHFNHPEYYDLDSQNNKYLLTIRLYAPYFLNVSDQSIICIQV